MKSKLSFVTIMLLLGGQALAEESATLDEVVISATGYEQEVKYAPASISVIPQEEILNRPIRDLGDIVQEVPGVATSVEKTGASSISIRGMSSAYTLILVDGKRVNMSRGFDSAGFDSTSGFLPPASMIERVEVIRGPASTIYGSDAMGGVINIITKKIPDEASASVGFETRLQEHHETWGNSQGINGNIFAPIGENFAINLRGKYYYGEKNNFYIVDIPGYNVDRADLVNPYTSHSPTGYVNANIGTRLIFMPNTENSLYLDVDYGFQRLGSLNTSNSQITAVRDYYKFNYILNHDGDYSFGKFNSYVHYSTTSILPHYTPGFIPTTGSLSQGVEPGRESGKRDHKSLTYNPAFTYQTTFTKNFNFGNAGALILNLGPYFFWERLLTRSNGFDKDAYQIAGFGEGEYLVNEYFSATAGIRVNYVQTYGTFVAPRAYINIYPTSWLTFKAGVASGLQVPQLSYRYDGLYSETGRGNSPVHSYGNANLEPEKSFNYEVSAIVSAPVLAFTLTGFITDFTDAIRTETYDDGVEIPGYGPCGAGTGGTCQMPINIDKARIWGVEAGINSSKLLADYTTGFYFDVAYAFTHTEQRSGADKGNPLNNVPKHNVSAKISYKRTSWETYLRYIGKYQTPTFGVHTANVGPGEYFKNIHTVDLGINYKTESKITLGLVVNNLLDQDTLDYFVYPGTRGLSYSNAYQRMIPGRNYWFNIRADF